jgi:hypothetical protein
MNAIALVGLPGSGRRIIAGHLEQQGYVAFPFSALVANFDHIRDIVSQMDGKIIIPDITTADEARFVRSELQARILGVRTAGITRSERTQNQVVSEVNKTLSALDVRGGEVAGEIATMVDSVVFGDVAETQLLQNVDRFISPPEQNAPNPERRG